jgi:hypothetical protein
MEIASLIPHLTYTKKHCRLQGTQLKGNYMGFHPEELYGSLL